jgi:hypothetical protein
MSKINNWMGKSKNAPKYLLILNQIITLFKMKNLLFFLYLFASLILVVSCIKEKEPTVDVKLKVSQISLTDTITLAYQTTLVDEESNLSLTFDSVLSESRCPIGVVCCWQGNVAVKLTLKKGSVEYPFTLDSYFIPDTTVGGYVFHFLDAAPYPDFNKPVDVSEYRVELVMN